MKERKKERKKEIKIILIQTSVFQEITWFQFTNNSTLKVVRYSNKYSDNYFEQR